MGGGQVTRSAAELLEDLAKLAALADLVKARQNALRSDLEAELLKVEAITGGAANVPVKGVGRAYITVPTLESAVDDPERFAAWAREAHPNHVEDRAWFDTVRIAELCAADPDLEQTLVNGGAIKVEAIYSEALIGDLLTAMPRNESGEVVDPGTGELVGASLRERSKRSLTVRIDPKTREAYSDELRALLGQSLLGPGGEA